MTGDRDLCQLADDARAVPVYIDPVGIQAAAVDPTSRVTPADAAPHRGTAYLAVAPKVVSVTTTPPPHQTRVTRPRER